MQVCILLLQYYLLHCQRIVLDLMVSVLKLRLQNTDADEQRLSQTLAFLTEPEKNFFSRLQFVNFNHKRKTPDDS